MRKPRRKFGATQKDRLFLACLPDAGTAARILTLAENLQARHAMGGTLTRPEHLHVTLFHLGDWIALPDQIVAAAMMAAQQIRAAPFDVAFDKARSFRNRTGVYPFVLTGPDRGTSLQAFHRVLGAALKTQGLGSAVHGEFQPHVTLLRDTARIAPQAIPPITWRVQDFVLIHSLLGQTKHVHLARWDIKEAP